jgi:hypothetical protein
VSTVDLLEEALASAGVGGSREVLAKRLSLSVQQISRALLRQSKLGTRPLIKAARLTRKNLFVALRDAGENDLADDLEALIGHTVTPEQQAVLDDLTSLPSDVRRHHVELIAERAAKERGEPLPRTASKRSKRRGSKR